MTNDDQDALEERVMDEEEALAPLYDAVVTWGRDNPDQYAGAWLARCADGTLTVAVGVVTVDGVGRELCGPPSDRHLEVVSMRHSLRDLTDVADRISETEFGARTDDRIVVVGVLEEENVVEVLTASGDVKGLEARLRAEYGSPAIRVRRGAPARR